MNISRRRSSIDVQTGYAVDSPQLTEHGDQSLHEVTAQCGSRSGLNRSVPISGHSGVSPAHMPLSIVSTWGHFFRPILKTKNRSYIIQVQFDVLLTC